MADENNPSVNQGYSDMGFPPSFYFQQNQQPGNIASIQSAENSTKTAAQIAAQNTVQNIQGNQQILPLQGKGQYSGYSYQNRPVTYIPSIQGTPFTPNQEYDYSPQYSPFSAQNTIPQGMPLSQGVPQGQIPQQIQYSQQPVLSDNTSWKQPVNVPQQYNQYNATEITNTAGNQPASQLFDYSYVTTPAQIAVYDDLLSEPRIITIQPAPTSDFIGNLAAAVYQNAQALGGTIAYSIILQVSENFIHARFSEMVVSIYNQGKTIRFSDQGPGFKNKDLALQPGFSSATQPMKRYIKGVGSGLPTVQEWLHLAKNDGKLTIEDNLNGGAVVTLSVAEEQSSSKQEQEQQKDRPFFMPPLTEKERLYLALFAREGALGITEMADLTGHSKATVHTDLGRMEQAGLIQNEQGTKRRILSDYGYEVVKHLNTLNK